MRFLVITADYDAYLAWHYRLHPGLDKASYREQLDARYLSLFGAADFYSHNLQELGHEASEIFVNNGWLQSAWAREHGLNIAPPPSPDRETNATSNEVIVRLKRTLQPYRKHLAPLAKRLGYMASLNAVQRRILGAQIEAQQPDVILNQIPEIVTSAFLNRFKRPGRTIIVQHGNQPPDDFDPSAYTFGIAIVPSIVEFFRARGLPTEYFDLAFEPSVLDRIGPAPKKDIEISFVGGLSANHAQRIELLEAVARELPIELYLSNFKGIPRSSPLHNRIRGEAWGRDMYNTLRRSKITLNSHVDAAGGVAANLRLYEGTGVGTFLLTDNLRNLSRLFEPGRQVGVYDSAQDCVAKIKYYLSNPAEREAIAAAGQQHTLAHHTYRQRMAWLLTMIDKYKR